MTKAGHIDALLHAWDEMDNAAARVSTSLPAQMTEAAARLERVRLETRAVVQRVALALSAPAVA